MLLRQQGHRPGSHHMEHIEEKLLLYGQLGETDRREVDDYLAAHPELRPLLEQAQAMSTLFAACRDLLSETPGDEILAYLLISRHIQHGRAMPEVLRPFFERIEARLASDPDLQRRYDVLKDRLHQLETGHDAVAQFERLTGTRLYAPDDGASDGQTRYVQEHTPPLSMAAEPPASYRSRPPETSTPPPALDPPPRRRPADRPAAAPARLRRVSRWAVAAVLGLFVAYGLLAVVSRLTQPPLERLAWIDPELLDLEGYDVQFRSDVRPDQDPAEVAYLNALAQLREAQTRTLGLFPRFDEDRLQDAEAELRKALASDENGFIHSEAQFLLAKVLLAQHRTAEAEGLLQQLAASNSRHADEAEALLNALRQHAEP